MGLFTKPRKRHSAEKLQKLHAALLSCVDVSDPDNSQRDEGEDDKKSLKKNPAVRMKTSMFQKVTDGGIVSDKNKSCDLDAAFRYLAATRSPDQEGDNFGAAALREDASVSAISMVQKIEAGVAELIRNIGDVVANGEKFDGSITSLRCNSVLEYFCEKNLLALLVDIAVDKPSPSTKIKQRFHGVVWGPLVKAQVLQTISLLISGMRSRPVLYYILSQNAINHLITSILPINQWTDPALDQIIPAYVDLLKNLALQVRGSSNLCPFFVADQSFPLFHAALETATSSFAQTDSHAHVSCLKIIISILQISHTPIRNAVCMAADEQRHLAEHLCQLLLNRFHRTANLATGPVVDSIRSYAISAQLLGLVNQIEVLNDVFCCGVQGLKIRLCELLLRRVVAFFLRHLLPPTERAFINVGETDADCVPKKEALAQTSLIFLSRLFLHLKYAPFVRMLSVALFHPNSSKVWKNFSQSEEEYILVPTLDSIAQGKDDDTVPNPYRKELIRSLKGDYGNWRFTPTAALIDSAIKSKLMDFNTIITLDIVPVAVDDGKYFPTEVEIALATFLERNQLYESSVVTSALECAGSLALELFHMSLVEIANTGTKMSDFCLTCANHPLFKAVVRATSCFCQNVLEAQTLLGVSDIFVNLVESAIRNRYKIMTSVHGKPAVATFAYLLSQNGCSKIGASPDVLVRRFRSVNSNDVENTRFYIQMALQFRALCAELQKLVEEVKMSSTEEIITLKKGALQLDLVDRADNMVLMVGGLNEKPNVGTDIDLGGRMTFRCFSARDRNNIRPIISPRNGSGRERTFSEDMSFQQASGLVLVLDPTDMFVVTPVNRNDVNQGTIMCRVSIQSVIAAAPDKDWLHVAVQHEDVGYLIKNGNMALRFDNPGTCLVVQQYLDRCRSFLRRELLEKVRDLFGPNAHKVSSIVNTEDCSSEQEDELPCSK